MTETLLEKLKKLQLERSDISPFSSHLDFLKWSDLVYPLLSFEPNLQSLFKRRIDTAKSLKAMDSSPDIQINEAIGILNQAVYSLEIMPIQNTATKPPASIGNEKINYPESYVSWHEKPLGNIWLSIVGTLLGAMVIYIFRTQLGISL